MANNQVVWTGYFGPFNIEINELTPQYNIVPNRIKERREFVDLVKNDIAKNGLLNPLDVTWYLNDKNKDKLIVAPGNDRLWAVRELGWKEVPCYLRVYAYQDNVEMAEVLKKFLPFIRESQSEDVKTAVEYKKWWGDKFIPPGG